MALYDALIQAHHRIGLGFTEAGQLETALEHFNKAQEAIAAAEKLSPGVTRLASRRAEVTSGQADIYQRTGDWQKAIETYNEALKLSPETAGIWVNRGNAYMMMGDNDKALADYNEAIRLDDAFAVAYANRGILLDNMQYWKRALADYRKVLELDPELAEAPSVWKRILYNTPADNINKRVKLLEKFEELDEQGLLQEKGAASPAPAE